MAGPTYDLEGRREIDSEFVRDHYDYTSQHPLPDLDPAQETAYQFNLTAEQVLQIVAEWEVDNNA